MSFYYDGISRAKNLEYRRGAKSHRWEDSWSDGTGRRSDPPRETSEPALRTPEYRSGSDAKKGERLLL